MSPLELEIGTGAALVIARLHAKVRSEHPMETNMRPILAASALSLAALSAPVLGQQQQAMDHSAHSASQHEMQMALSAQNRTEDRARDQWRHPAETLTFFQVEPGMTVVDYMPASGWYTRVLTPYLGTNGRYIGLTPDPAAASNERFAEYFAGLPADFREKSPSWNLTGAPTAIYASGEVPEEMAGKVDRVLIFREMHNLHRSGAMHTELGRIREMLADDGMLGVVQHRAKEDASGDYTNGNNGYLRQKDVVGLIEAHGFELVSASEINANPRDTADYEGGVWTLPPSMRGDNEAMRAVGESDRMTLLFQKR